MNHSREGVYKWLKCLLWHWKRGFRYRKWCCGRVSGFSQELCHSGEGGTRPPLGHRQQKLTLNGSVSFLSACVLWSEPFKQENGCPSRRCPEWLELFVSYWQKCLSQLKHVAAEKNSGSATCEVSFWGVKFGRNSSLVKGSNIFATGFSLGVRKV